MSRVGVFGGRAVEPRDDIGVVTYVQHELVGPLLRGGSRERMVKDAASADSLLSTAPTGKKVRPAVFVHLW